MIRVRVTCRAVSALLMNPATEELIEQLRTKTPKQKRRDWSAQEEASTKLYISDTGKIGIPVENLYASLVEAGRDISLPGRQKISTATSTRLYAFISIEEQFLPFPDDCQEWKADKRRGVNPNGKEMVAVVRPRFEQWSITFTVVIDDKLIEPSKIRELIEIAGRSVGLCDFRPGRRGPFGRSTVAAWEVLSSDKSPTLNGNESMLVSA